MVRGITRNSDVAVQAEAWPRLDLRKWKNRDLKRGEGQASKHRRWWSCEPWRLPVVAMVMENRRWCPTYSKVWWKRENFWYLVTVPVGILGIFRWEKAQYRRNRRSGPVAVPWREKASIREREREFWMLVFCSRGDTMQGLKHFRGEIVFLWFDDVSNLRAIGLNKRMRFKPLVWSWCGTE